jgi:hypothetical protein
MRPFPMKGKLSALNLRRKHMPPFHSNQRLQDDSLLESLVNLVSLVRCAVSSKRTTKYFMKVDHGDDEFLLANSW